MKDRLCLPYRKPMRTGSNKDLCPLSIVAAEDVSDNWIFNHYTAFHTISNEEGNIWPYLEFDNTMGFITPLNTYLYHKHCINNPVEFCQTQLENKGYIFVNCDLFYIPSSKAYKSYHKMGEIFITGYDLNKSTFLVFGYTDNYELKEAEIDMQDLKKAFNTDVFCEQECHETYQLAKVFCLDKEYKFCTSNEKVARDIKNILDRNSKKLLPEGLDFPNVHFDNTKAHDEYLAVFEHAKSFFGQFEHRYGLDNYDRIADVLSSKVDSGKYEQYMVSQWVDALFEHMQNLQFKFNIINGQFGLREEGDISGIEEAVKKAKTIKNLSVKFNLIKDKSILLKLLDQVNALKSIEVKLLQYMYDLLQQEVT